MRKQVRKLRNLTSQEVYCYGTSGELARLAPEDIAPDEITKLGDPEKDTLYIADGRLYIVLFRDHRYHDKVISLRFIGNARGGEELYKFEDIFGNDVKLITENVIGSSTTTRIQFAYESRWRLVQT